MPAADDLVRFGRSKFLLAQNTPLAFDVNIKSASISNIQLTLA